MSIRDETEADTRAERIDPVLAASSGEQCGSKVLREVIYQGSIPSRLNKVFDRLQGRNL